MSTSRGPVSKNVESRNLGFMQIRVGKSAANISNPLPCLAAANSIGAMASTKLTATRENYNYESGTPKNLDGVEALSTMASVECAFLEHKPFNYALANGLDPIGDVSAAIHVGETNSDAGTTTGDITVDDAGGAVNDRFTVFFTGATAGKIIGEKSGVVYTFAALDSEMAPDNDGNPYFTIPASFFTGTWTADDSFTFWTTKAETGTALYGNVDQGSIPLGVGGQPAYVRVEAIFEYADGHKMIIILPRAQSSSGIDAAQAEQESNVPIVFQGSQAHEDISGGNAAWNLNLTDGIGPLGRIYFQQAA